MANKVLLKKSSVTGKIPTTADLDYGELALNYTDGKLYYKTATNTIGAFATGSGTVTSVSGTGTVSGLTLSGTVTSSGNLTLGGTLSLTSTNVTDALGYTPYNSTNPSGYITSSASITGNAATATTFIGDQTNWATYRSSAVANMLGWKAYGNSHVIFDASASTSPIGTAISRTDSTYAWGGSYPTLMGWNGSATYGVRVDSARQADILYSSASASATIYYDYNNTAYYADPASTSRMSGINFDVLYYAADTNYGFVGASVYADTINSGYAGDSLEINYVRGTWAGISHDSLRAPLYYDYDNTSYYVDPASTSNVNGILTSSAVSDNNSGLRNVLPGGGSYVTGTAYVYGAIVITLPTNSYPMLRFTVKVYTYDGLSFDITCGGHTSGGTWYNTFAYMNTQNRPAMNVRFCYGGGQVFVYIGDISASWQYPQVFITDVQVGYSADTASNWDNGWSIGFNSSTYNNVSATHTVFAPSSSSNNSQPIYASVLYDANNTGYYCDPSSSSYLYDLALSGSVYFRPNTWIQFNDAYGLYWPNNNGAHLQANSLSSYSSLAIRGSKNGWGGIYDHYSAVACMFESAGNGGFYREANGRWYLYYNIGNDCWGFGTSTTSSTWNAYGDKGFYAGTRMDSPIYYDASNTAYYADPASTSNFNVTKTVSIIETKAAIAASAIDVNLGNYFTKTISGATTFTANAISSGNVSSFILELTNAGSAAITWFSGVKWAGGTAPTLTSSGVDILGFYTHDGGATWRGLVLAKDSK